MVFRRKIRAQRTQSDHGNRSLTREEKDAKAQYEQLRRRSWSLVRKSKELKERCDRVKVFTLVVDEARNRGHLFSSVTLSDTWPPSGLDLVSSLEVTTGMANSL